MTSHAFKPAVHGFLAAFFGAGNRLAWPQVEAKLHAGNLDPGLAPWLERLAQVPDLPTLLPRPTDDATLWYGLGHSFAQAEQLREELLAAVGPTYSDFVGYRADLNPDDPVECAVLEFTGGHAFRLRVPAVHRDAARAALDRLRRLWEQRPQHVGAVVRSVGRMLREFELALTVGDLNEAGTRLNELRTGGMLDARNLSFLEIRVLAAGERWAEIMTLPALPDLAHVRCPVVVADAVLQALYAVEFAAFEDGDGPAMALARFHERALGRWSSFFRVKSTIRSLAALKLFMMLAVSANPPRTELRDAVLAEPMLAGADRAYCEALAALATSVTPSAIDPLTLACKRYDAGDYDGAFPAALAASPSTERLRLVLNCAVELARLEATTAVLEAFASAPPAMRDAVLASGRDRVLWQHLVGVATPPEVVSEALPADWLAWLERLTRTTEWPKALEVAEQGAREWDAQEFLREGARVQRFRALLADRAARTTSAQATLRDALPFLIGFLTREHGLLARSRGVLEDVLLLLTDDAEAGAADMAAVKEVVATLIEVGPAATDYRELVEFLRATWERFEAPRRLDWLLEALETLVVNPAPALDARALFVECVFAAFAKWRPHVSATRWRLLSVLCRDLGLTAEFATVAPDTRESQTGPSLAEALRGRTVVIHSLMERPALHARDALIAVCPDVKVVLNADHVATTQLREYARQADVFVMVWRAAKHAATGCVEATRPKHLPLLRPDGRSATAILREITEWCERGEKAENV